MRTKRMKFNKERPTNSPRLWKDSATVLILKMDTFIIEQS